MLYTKIPQYEDLDQDSKIVYHEDKEKYDNIARKNGASLLFAKSGLEEETWVPLIEKAYAKFYNNYAHLVGGWARDGIENLTGGVSFEFITKDILDVERFWKEELLQVNKDRLFGAYVADLFATPWEEPSHPTSIHGLLGNHTYAVLRAVECLGKRFVVVRNPWGTCGWKGPWSNGSSEWTPKWIRILPQLGHTFGDNGQFIMEYKDFVQSFTCIEKTYLLDDSWTVNSQWLNVQPKEQPVASSYGNLSYIPFRELKHSLVATTLQEVIEADFANANKDTAEQQERWQEETPKPDEGSATKPDEKGDTANAEGPEDDFVLDYTTEKVAQTSTDPPSHGDATGRVKAEGTKEVSEVVDHHHCRLFVTILLAGLDILAIVGLALIWALKSPSREDESNTNDANSDNRSYTESVFSADDSNSSYVSRYRCPPPHPHSPDPSPPNLSQPTTQDREGTEWQDLLKDSNDIVLGLRVYTQTEYPAKIAHRLVPEIPHRSQPQAGALACPVNGWLPGVY
ncbi:hypothetical protein H1R20_g6337, partial [Candolleomyces eurysporus]